MKTVVAVVCLGAVTLFAGTGLASSSARSGFGARAGQMQAKIKPHYVETLYDNGPDDGMNAYAINFGFSVANSFSLVSYHGTVLQAATFSNWLFPGDAASSVDWAITSEPFGGTMFASGTAALTGVDQGINDFGLDVIEQTFSTGFGLNLDDGTYYLQLGNEVVSNGDSGYWGESNGPSFACQSGNGLDCLEIPSESFQIFGGNIPGVPEPGSWVLLGTGLLGVTGAVRRKIRG